MPRLHLVADAINHYEELIQNYPVRSINANKIGNRLCLQRLVSVVNIISEQDWRLETMKTLDRPESFFKKFSKLF